MIQLVQGDCLEKMQEIPDRSIDMILTDLPYGTTACKWDSVVDLNAMWTQLKRIIKPKRTTALFGTEPFSSTLRLKNIEQYKYDWVWQKDKATNHLNAKRMPMRRNEFISIFYESPNLYKPQLMEKKSKNIRPPRKKSVQIECYGKMTSESKRSIPVNLTYPNETLKFPGCAGHKGRSFHPTQKPVALMEYLIRTYTNICETVLDFTMGSGTTGVACQNLHRNFIGIELDPDYFNIAQKRLANNGASSRL